MIKVTAKANQAIDEYFSDKKQSSIRIFLKMGGCGIRSFGITFGEANPSDLAFNVSGYTYIVENSLLEQYGPIKIDSDGFSFRLSGNGIYPPFGCGTCGFGCNSGEGKGCTGVCSSCETPCKTGKRIKARRQKRV